jgi:hypothetical protein
MTALAPHWVGLERPALIRGIAGGAAWGVTVATALLALTLYQCGTICLGQIVETTTLSIAAGILTMGPLAAFRRPSDAAVQ